MADADIAQGVVFKRNGSTVGSVTSVSGPTLQLETVDITDLASTWREHKGVLLNGGEVTLALNYLYDDAGHLGLKSDLTSKTLQAFSIDFTDASTTTASFNAYVTALGTEAAVAGVVTANVTLLISGAVTWA